MTCSFTAWMEPQRPQSSYGFPTVRAQIVGGCLRSATLRDVLFVGSGTSSVLVDVRQRESSSGGACGRPPTDQPRRPSPLPLEVPLPVKARWLSVVVADPFAKCSNVSRGSEKARHEADDGRGDPAVAIMGRGFALPSHSHWRSLPVSAVHSAALPFKPNSLRRSARNCGARGYAERVTLCRASARKT